MNYYNEHDQFAAQWLRNLIAAGLIPAGEVDERSITEVQPSDLQGFTQCHFFAGIGGWSLALELAGWPTDACVWTGSCPCQPFSAAGKRKGTADERHLWPDFYRLIAECKPPVVFGEQVASKDGLRWFDGVRADLEASGYAVGAADLCAASGGSPHIRQRLWWVAHAEHGRSTIEEPGAKPGGEDSRVVGRVAHTDGRLQGNGDVQRSGEHGQQPQDRGIVSGLCDARSTGLQERISERRIQRGATVAKPWEAFELASCRDGKARRIEPGSQPLAHGIPRRMGRIRAYGNAIVPQVGAEFIQAYLEAIGE